MNTMAAVIAGLVLVFAAAVVSMTLLLRSDLRQAIIQRDADVLSAVANMLATEAEDRFESQPDPLELRFTLDEIAAVAASVRGVVGASWHTPQGRFVSGVPEDLLPLPLETHQIDAAIKNPVATFHPALAFENVFFSQPTNTPLPFLEVIAPVNLFGRPAMLRFWIDGENTRLAFTDLDKRLIAQGTVSLSIGCLTIAGLSTLFATRLARRGRQLREAKLDLHMHTKSAALGSIAASLIHDLRSPLATLQLAADSPGENTAVAIEQARRMQEMVTTIIDILRDQENADAVEMNWEDIELALHRTLDDAGRLQFHGPSELRFHPRQGGPLSLAIKQIAANALQHSPPPSPVEIACKPGDQGQPTTITITDQGNGLPQQIRDSLFRPIQKATTKGSGLGLSIARQLLTSIGATLELAESSDAGTTFEITLNNTST